MPWHVFDMTCDERQQAQNKRPPLTLTLSPLSAEMGRGNQHPLAPRCAFELPPVL